MIRKLRYLRYLNLFCWLRSYWLAEKWEQGNNPELYQLPWTNYPAVLNLPGFLLWLEKCKQKIKQTLALKTINNWKKKQPTTYSNVLQLSSECFWDVFIALFPPLLIGVRGEVFYRQETSQYNHVVHTMSKFHEQGLKTLTAWYWGHVWPKNLPLHVARLQWQNKATGQEKSLCNTCIRL